MKLHEIVLNQTLSMIERGGQNATLLSIHETAQALRVRPADLLADPPAGSAD